jgi:7-cyano-7-deazaguanine synthase
MNSKNAIILCSGGLDSTTAAYYTKKRLNYKKIIILFFDYQQRTLAQERKSAQETAKSLKADFKEINLPELGKISDSLINKSEKAKKIKRKALKDSKKESLKYYVPCRNIVFLTYALAIAESLQIKDNETWDILTGFKNEGKEAYPDTTPEFIKEINNLKQTATEIKGNIIAPLIKMDKEDIVLLGNRLGVKMEDTYSCYIGAGRKHCGTCLACRLRQEAFYWANVKDKTRYKERMKDYRSA